MPFIRTKTAIQDCEKHLINEPEDSPIKSYLAQYLSVLLCADMQQEIYRLAEKHAATAGMECLRLFVSQAACKLLRSVKSSEISGFMGCYGNKIQKCFDLSLIEKEVSIYNNMVNARHDVAHKGSAAITFMDIKNAVAIAERFIKTIEDTLGNSEKAEKIEIK